MAAKRKQPRLTGEGWQPVQLIAQDPTLDIELWEGVIGIQVVFAVFPPGDWKDGGHFYAEEIHAHREYDRVSGGGLHLAGVASAAADMEDLDDTDERPTC